MNAPTASLAGLDLRADIDRLRKDRNAVILAHYYQVLHQLLGGGEGA